MINYSPSVVPHNPWPTRCATVILKFSIPFILMLETVPVQPVSQHFLQLWGSLSFPLSQEEKHCTFHKHVYAPFCIAMQLMLLFYLQESYLTALHALVKMKCKIPHIMYIYNLQWSLLRDSDTNWKLTIPSNKKKNFTKLRMHIWQKIWTTMYPRSCSEQVHAYPHNFCNVNRYYSYNTTVLTSAVLVTQYLAKR